MKPNQQFLRLKQLNDENSFCDQITLLISPQDRVFLQARQATRMGPGFPTIRITGYSSVDQISDAFTSHLMEVAFLVHVDDRLALAVAQDHDDIDWSSIDERDRIKNLIREKLMLAGVRDVEIVIVVLDA